MLVLNKPISGSQSLNSTVAGKMLWKSLELGVEFFVKSGDKATIRETHQAESVPESQIWFLIVISWVLCPTGSLPPQI